MVLCAEISRTTPGYCHPTGHFVLADYDGNAPDEWELYCLITDPVEQTNLVIFRVGEVRDDQTAPGLTKNQLELKNRQLKKVLTHQEAVMLGKSG
jgi:hypothetical protein